MDDESGDDPDDRPAPETKAEALYSSLITSGKIRATVKNSITNVDAQLVQVLRSKPRQSRSFSES